MVRHYDQSIPPHSGGSGLDVALFVYFSIFHTAIKQKANRNLLAPEQYTTIIYRVSIAESQDRRPDPFYDQKRMIDLMKKLLEDHGKYLELWKKSGVKWLCYHDMYSSDQAAPAPAK